MSENRTGDFLLYGNSGCQRVKENMLLR